MPYLGNIPEIGELTEEKILFEFDKIPIIFVCHNQTRKKYLCVCTDCIVGYSWLLTEITRTTLIELIKDKISVLKAFEISKNKIYSINREENQYSYEKYNFADIPEEELPDAEEKLENPFLTDYLAQLEVEDSVTNVRWEMEDILKAFFIVSKPKTVNMEINISNDRENDINKYSESKDFGMVETSELPYMCENTNDNKIYIRKGKLNSCSLLI